MYDVKIRIFLCRRPQASQCHQMLSADHKWDLSILQDLRGTRLDLVQRHLRTAHSQFQVAAVIYDIFRQLFVLIRAVDFQPVRIISHRLPGEPGSRTEGCGGVKGRSEQDNFRRLILSIASDKVYCILPLHLSTSSSKAST